MKTSKPRVLITSVGRKVWLVRAFQLAGWYVIGQDKSAEAVARRFCDEPDENYNLEVDLIVPTRDAELHYFAGQPFVASKWTLDRCLDKFAFYKHCKEHGFLTPEVYFVKPRISKSGKETECVWQEVVEGNEYSVDLFASQSGEIISVIPRQRLLTVAGESYVTITVSNRILVTESIRLARSLRLVGHNVMQAFQNGKKRPIWTDVNCRFGGASACGIAAGCYSPSWMRDLLIGKEVRPRIGDYEVGLKMMRFTEDYYERQGR